MKTKKEEMKMKTGGEEEKKEKKALRLPRLDPNAAVNASSERKMLYSRVYHQQRDAAGKSEKTMDESKEIAKAATQNAVAEKFDADLSL